jgi:hypothetical protein
MTCHAIPPLRPAYAVRLGFSVCPTVSVSRHNGGPSSQISSFGGRVRTRRGCHRLVGDSVLVVSLSLWTSPTNAHLLIPFPSENPVGGEWVMRCDNATSTDPSWCCSAQDCCSNPSAARLQIGVASVTATVGVQPTSSGSTSRTSTSTSTSSTGATSSSTAAPTTTATSASAAGNAISASAAVSNNPQSSSSNNTGSNSGTKIGLGVGLGVGIPLLILASAGFFFLGRRRRQINHNHDQLNSTGSVYDSSYYPDELKEGGAKRPVYGGGPPSVVAELQSDYDGRYQNHSEGRPVELQGD